MKRLIKIIIKAILVVILLFSLYKIGSKINSYIKDSGTYNNIREKYGIDSNNELNNILVNSDYKNLIKEKFNLLKEQNIDYKLWLTIEETNIDYPVVQGTDNEFYLNNDFNKNQSISGCIFIDYRTNIDEDNNIIIYGHNMRNKEMFNNLSKYKEEKFFNSKNKIIITTDKEVEEYEVFSLYIEEASDIYKGNILENFNNYINEIKSKSLYKTNIEVNEKDKLIALVTCSFEYGDARTVVWGRKI